jgi:hypothetical protein
MRKQTMKISKTILAASLLAAGFSGIASAHDYVGSVGNATVNAASDKFWIQCAGGSSYATLRVRDNPTSPEKATKVSIRGATSLAGLSAATWYTDTTDTDATTFDTSFSGPYGTAANPQPRVTGGPAIYYFEVNKNMMAGVTGAEAYIARIHCYDSSNTHNPEDQPTSVTYIQNQ